MTLAVLPMALERRVLRAPLIFEAVDVFASDRRVRGERPRPLGELRFTLLGFMAGGARTDLDRPLELVVTRNPSGYYLFHGQVRTAAGERRRFDLAALPGPVTVAVRVESDFYQVVEFEGIGLGHRHSFELAPGFAYPFPRESTLSMSRPPTLLRGRLRSPDGDGIGGATIEVVGQSEIYRTDMSGQWVLVFADAPPPSNPLKVRFVIPNASAVDVGEVEVEPGRTNGFQQAALTGLVLNDTGVPIRGARVSVDGHPGEALSVGDGSFTFYFSVEEFPPNQPAGSVDVTAEFDGNQLNKSGVRVAPRQSATVPTFRFQL